MNVSNRPSLPATGLPAVGAPQVVFPDRRNQYPQNAPPVIERRQFGNSHSDLSPEARELGLAIDQYKLVHRRRYITYEEMLNVVRSLGYHK